MCSVKPQNDLLHKGRAVEEWADLHFFRPIGIRIARALQADGNLGGPGDPVVARHRLVAGHLFAYRDRWTNVIGFVLFIVSDIFDSADGQLARLRGTSTRFGRVLDGASDSLRFINLYFHLIYRLIQSGFWWPGAFCWHGSGAGAYLPGRRRGLRAQCLLVHRHRQQGGAGPPGRRRSGTVGNRRGAVRNAGVPRLCRAAGAALPPHGQARPPAASRQRERSVPCRVPRASEIVLPLCAWLGQNIRFLLLGVAALAAHISAFLWVERSG